MKKARQKGCMSYFQCRQVLVIIKGVNKGNQILSLINWKAELYIKTASCQTNQEAIAFTHSRGLLWRIFNLQSGQEISPGVLLVQYWIIKGRRKKKFFWQVHEEWKPDDVMELFDMASRSKDGAWRDVSTFGHTQKKP